LKRRYQGIDLDVEHPIMSNKVWENTHSLGGKLFKISGVVILLGIIFPVHILYFVLVPVIFSALFLVVYSYWRYRQLSK
jgi:uncharacterized membrane protein